jgi:MFS family permease
MVVLVVTSGIKSDPAAYPLLLIATAFLGAGFGLTVPVLNTYLAAFRPDRADKAVLVLNALLGLGTAWRRSSSLSSSAWASGGGCPCCPPYCSSCSCLRALGYP